ncbi:MAG: hypothetical protein ACI8PZ_007222 [Myxococcota bacterium]|jgi:hypothetical protein
MPAFADPMPHADLTEVWPDIFVLQGTVRMGPGMVINRNMVVLRDEGRLTVINSVRPQPDSVAALDALGVVTNVVKIGLHGMDDAWFVDHYQAKLWAAPGMEAAAPVGQELSPDGPQPVPWVRTFAFRDTKKPELALLADRAGGVLITCDAVQNWTDTAQCSLAAKLVTKAMGFSARPANIGPPWRKRMTPEGGSLQADFERLVAEPFDNLIGGHGQPMRGGANEALKATIAAVF